MRILSLVAGSVLVGAFVGLAMAYVEIGRYQPPSVVEKSVGPSGTDTVATEKLPHLVVDEAEHNFGHMQRGTLKSHKFVIFNEGESPLHLEVGQPTCKCTVGELDKRVLQPGESVDLRVEWKANSPEGEFRQSVPLFSNDPRNSRVQLTIVGEITPTTGLFPSTFSLDRIRVGESKQADVYLTTFLQDELVVATAEIADPDARQHFAVAMENVPVEELPNENATAGVRMTVTAKPTLPVGRFVQYLALQTNLAGSEKLEIPIEGHVVGDIFIRGRGWLEEQGVLRLGRVLGSEGTRTELNVIVRGKEAKDVEIEVVDATPSALNVTLGEPKRYKDELFHIPLIVEVPAGTGPIARLNPDIHGPATITLATTHPQAPQLTLDVRFAVE